MHTDTPFPLRKERGVGDVINATFEFIRQEFTPLLKSLLFIVGPILGLSMVLSTYDWVLAVEPGMNPILAERPISAAIGLAYVLMALGFLLSVGVVYGYVRYYDEHGGRSPSVAEVWDYARSELWAVLAVSFVIVIVSLGAYFVIALGVMLLTIGAAGMLGVGGAILGGILAFFSMIAGVLFVMVSLAFAIPARLFEPISATDALGRSWRLVAGRRWSTLGVILVAALVQFVLSIIFQVPLYVVLYGASIIGVENSGGAFWGGLSVLTGALGGVGAAVLYAIPLLALLFQYFSIVEQKERVGLMERVRRLEADVAPEEPSADAGPSYSL